MPALRCQLHGCPDSASRDLDFDHGPGPLVRRPFRVEGRLAASMNQQSFGALLIRTEWPHRQSRGILNRDDRERRPGVSNGRRLGNLVIPDNDLLSFDFPVRPNPIALRAADRKALERAAITGAKSIGILEA